MSDRRNPLLPDDDGHYAPEMLAMDRALRRTISLGRHPMDELAREMAVQETRRRFFSRAAKGIGAVALASLAAENSRAAASATDAVGGLPGLPQFRAQGQALPVLSPGGRAAADGDLRLQAEDAGAFR